MILLQWYKQPKYQRASGDFGQDLPKSIKSCNGNCAETILPIWDYT